MGSLIQMVLAEQDTLAAVSLREIIIESPWLIGPWCRLDRYFFCSHSGVLQFTTSF